jgi:anti-anti-sigma regulatory factor
LVALRTIAGRAISRDGEMVWCGVGDRVSEVLSLAGFDQTLGIFPDVAAAKASFGTG